jgi:hypothetical protein
MAAGYHPLPPLFSPLSPFLAELFPLLTGSMQKSHQKGSSQVESLFEYFFFYFLEQEAEEWRHCLLDEETIEDLANFQSLIKL